MGNSSSVSTFQKGQALEDEVADIYRDFDGVREVKQNHLISGTQVDIYIEMESPDGVLNRMAIDTKNYEGNVPSEEVRKCATDLKLLKINGHIDRGIILASHGFTKDAQAAAADSGITTMLIKDLRNRASGFAAYLRSWMEAFEKSDMFKQDIYVPLSSRSDDGALLGKADDYVLKWLKKPGTLITLLGNYGTGKSTTLRQVMYRQAKLYLKVHTQNAFQFLWILSNSGRPPGRRP